MDMFNSFLNDTTLIELIRGGSRFTWTNKQENPIRSNLDKVLVNREWEQHYPKVRVMTLTRVGSDHNPILLDDGSEGVKVKRWFIFESTWLSNAEFKKKLIERWHVRNGEEIQDFWRRLKKRNKTVEQRVGG
jgi:hypothetical protein